MELAAIIIAFGTGIAIGMYITSQLSEWIDRRTQNRDLLDNLKKMEEKELKLKKNV